MDNPYIRDSDTINFKRQMILSAVIPFVICLFMYSGTFGMSYLYYDDYRFLATGIPIKEFLYIGRPVTALYLLAFPSVSTQLVDANYFRLFAMVLASLQSGLVIHWCRRQGFDSYFAWGAGISLLALPSISLFILWVNTNSSLIASLSSTVAALVMTKSFSEPKKKNRFLHYASVFILLQLALFTYQPAAMFFWSLWCIYVFRIRQKEWHAKRGNILAVLLVGTISIGIYFLLLKLMQRLIPFDYSRTSLVKDFSGKLYWFLRGPLVQAFSLWSMPPSTFLFFATIFFVCSPIVAFLIKAIRTDGISRKGYLSIGLQRMAILIVLVSLSHSPNIVVAENWATYRSSFALSSTALFLVFCSGLYWFSLLNNNIYRKFIYGLIMLLVLAGCLQTSIITSQTFIEPQVFEFNFIKYRLRLVNLTELRHIHVVCPKWYEGLSKIVYQDEYGIPSSVHGVLAVQMVKIALRELGIDYSQIILSSSAEEVIPEYADHTLVIDMRDMKYFR